MRYDGVVINLVKRDVSVSTVGLLLIGNELLTGKIQDLNGHYLAKTCFDKGAVLQNITVVADTHSAIANAVDRLRKEVDILITSGGVGPTHDDITYEGIAQALGVGLAAHPILLEQIEGYFGKRTTDAHRTMAYLPEGSNLDFPNGASWPIVSVDNIYIFPGVPHIFAKKVDSIVHRLTGPQKKRRILRLKGDEGTIAAHLAWAESAFDVEIGSYPVFERPDINIHVTIEGEQASALTAAYNALQERLSTLVSKLEADTDAS